MMDMKPLETVAEPGPGLADRVFSPPQVDIVVPVKDEERDLGPSVRRLRAFLRDEFPFTGPYHDRRQRQHRPHLGRRHAA